jgi:hypothetical protein
MMPLDQISVNQSFVLVWSWTALEDFVEIRKIAMVVAFVATTLVS